MKWVTRAVALAVLALAIWWLWQRVFATDETRIKRLIGSMTQAVERGNLLRLEDAIASDYSDGFGLDKSSVLGAIRSFRSTYEQMFIILSDMEIRVEPDHQTAEAVFIAKVLARAKGTTDAELRTDRYRLQFRKTDQGWKLYRAESPELKFD